MRKNFLQYFKQSLHDFAEAIINLTMFFPYFFSVYPLLSTLFSPWKNLVSKKNTVGFSFGEWANRLGFNLISRGIGCIMRSSIIFAYFIVQVLFLISLPLILVTYFILLPMFYLLYLYGKTEDEKKNQLKTEFLATHIFKSENTEIVLQWFENYYRQKIYKSAWWKLSNLFSWPPMARNWAVGYTPTLDEYAEDLASSAYQNNIKKIFGRQKEIETIERILSKSNEANVIIVGEEGVGKHSLVDALAQRIYEGKTTNLLAYKRVLKLNMEKILTQNSDQKQREYFLEELFSEAAEAKNVILMIEDIDKYVSDQSGRIDLTSPIEKFGKTSSIQIIGITTPFMYEKCIFNNGKINRLFSKVDVVEVSKTSAEQILLDKAFDFEERYELSIPYETIKNIIDKSDFYITNIPFPEKALDLMDNACAYTVQTLKKDQVTPDVIDIILTEKTHVPTTLSEEMKQKLVSLEGLLKTQIIHQEEAINKLAASLRRSFVLIGKRKKPLATFMFLGPTGVGKTETAKTITKVFFGSDKHLLRFDMSLYQTKEDIDKLIGNIEINNPGLLTQTIRENPYGVLLLDEIEKADKNLLNIFLTILDEGYFTDGFGKRVDCKNLVIIATSNAGAEILFQSSVPVTDEQMVNYLIANKIFTPEFLNRFDGVVLYNSLDNQSVILIAKKLIAGIADNIMKLYKVKVQISETFINNLVQKGYNEKFGARNMERLVRDEIEDKVAKMILNNEAKEGDTIGM